MSDSNATINIRSSELSVDELGPFRNSSQRRTWAAHGLLPT